MGEKLWIQASVFCAHFNFVLLKAANTDMGRGIRSRGTLVPPSGKTLAFSSFDVNPSFCQGHTESNETHETVFQYLSTQLKRELPTVRSQPLFYIRVYTIINITIAMVSVMLIATTHAAGLRASRILFRRLLVKVTRATMRWHVSSLPSLLTFSDINGGNRRI